MDAPGIHFQRQKIPRSIICKLAGVSDHPKGICRSTQNLVGWRKEGKMRRGKSRIRSALGRWGSWSRGKRPTLGQSVGTEGKHLRLSESTAANLWRSEWNENHTDSLCCGPMYPGQGCKSTRKHSGWELERRDWRAIAAQGLLLTAGRWPEGKAGRRTPWRKPLEESRAAVAAGRCCWAVCRAGATIGASLSPHASTGSWPTEKDPRGGSPLSSCCPKQ